MLTDCVETRFRPVFRFSLFLRATRIHIFVYIYCLNKVLPVKQYNCKQSPYANGIQSTTKNPRRKMSRGSLSARKTRRKSRRQWPRSYGKGKSKRPNAVHRPWMSRPRALRPRPYLRQRDAATQTIRNWVGRLPESLVRKHPPYTPQP